MPTNNLKNENIISVEEAVSRIQAYREKTSPLYPEGRMPKAILIPIADVQEILERFNNSPEADRQGIRGIRVYFSMMADDPDDNSVRGLVVPVREDGTDIIIPDGEGDSSIYDFTKPCPPLCDTSSVLSEA